MRQRIPVRRKMTNSPTSSTPQKATASVPAFILPPSAGHDLRNIPIFPKQEGVPAQAAGPIQRQAAPVNGVIQRTEDTDSWCENEFMTQVDVALGEDGWNWLEKVATSPSEHTEEVQAIKQEGENNEMWVYLHYCEQLYALWQQRPEPRNDIDAYLTGKYANCPAYLETLFTNILGGSVSTTIETGKTEKAFQTPLSWEDDTKLKPDEERAAKEFFSGETGSKQPRHALSEGKPSEKTQVAGGGEAWLSHGVDYTGPEMKKRKGGFTFNYEGEQAGKAEWLQFISVEQIETIEGEQKHSDPGGDAKVTYTLDPNKRIYRVDYSVGDNALYPNGYRTATQARMFDDPTPNQTGIKEALARGATKVVEIDQFDTFLLIDGKPVYHGSLKVEFVCDATNVKATNEDKPHEKLKNYNVPITKTSRALKVEPASGFSDEMQQALAIDKIRTDKNKEEREKKAQSGQKAL